LAITRVLELLRGGTFFTKTTFLELFHRKPSTAEIKEIQVEGTKPHEICKRRQSYGLVNSTEKNATWQGGAETATAV